MKDKFRIKNRIESFVQQKINAFSPTISPAPKSIERGEIESILAGIKYYLNLGINELVFQKKYMGSYCDIYLFKNIEDTYFVSRNGFRVKAIEKEQIVSLCTELHNRFEWDRLSFVIVQSELLPWRALGSNLVENEFHPYLFSHQHHSSYLKESNLLEKIKSVKASQPFLDMVGDIESLDEKLLKKKYPSHIVRQYQAVHDFNVFDIDKHDEGIHRFEQQLKHYGRESAIEIKPFNILKYVYDDGQEKLPNDNLTFSQINDDEYKHIIFEKGEINMDDVDEIYDWYKGLAADMEEGIMIKPRLAFSDNIPPALKVRNDDYLTLIYGIDFQMYYERNLRRRNISEKLKASIRDWELNKELLNVKYSDISSENYYFKNLVYDRIMEEESQASLDHRL